MIHVLVLGATGKQGSNVCDALLTEKKFVVHGMTRDAKSSAAKKLEAKGVLPIEGDVNSKESIESALRATKSTYLFIVTLMGTKKSEISAGKAAIDAAIACSLAYVVFSSVADCDICYDNIAHFKSKLEIENYLKSTTLKYTILRTVAFLDNFDDPANYNPLTRGSVKGLFRGDVKIKMVACKDIGKAAAQMFLDPEKYNGKTITCVSCDASGDEVAAALSSASNETCKYSIAIPRFALRLFFPDLYHMTVYFEKEGNSLTSDDIAEFLKIVPDALDAKGFFKIKGRWANGEEFGSSPPPRSRICCIF